MEDDRCRAADSIYIEYAQHAVTSDEGKLLWIEAIYNGLGDESTSKDSGV